MKFETDVTSRVFVELDETEARALDRELAQAMADTIDPRSWPALYAFQSELQRHIVLIDARNYQGPG